MAAATSKPTSARDPVRRWLRRLAAVLGVLVVAAVGAGTWVYVAAYQSNVGELAFTNPLKIPPVLEPTVDAQGRKRFQLTLQAGRTELLPGTTTETWGVNGTYLGPTLRASRGDQVAVDVVNQLPETTTVHWHGMRLPAEMDGGPHQPIPTGTTWSPYWTVDQPAASLWYHPHLHGRTAEHVYRGVTGMFLIDDESPQLNLPDDYGVDDIPLVVQDKQFNDDGSLNLSTSGPLGAQDTYGLLGDRILVNGTYDPYLQISSTRVRLRVLNATNARSLHVGFTDDRPFHLIGTDSGLLAAPERLDRVRLSPGEGVEIVADFRPGEQVVLRSFAPGQGGGFPQDRLAGGDDDFDLVKIVANDQLTESAPVPPLLATTPEITAPAGATVRTFRLSGTSRINENQMGPQRIDEVVPAGAREIWEVTNPGKPAQLPHPRGRLPYPGHRRRGTTALRTGSQGHRLPATGIDGPARGPVRSTHRPGQPVHVPLPHARTRGRRHDGPVRDRRARHREPGAQAPSRRQSPSIAWPLNAAQVHQH